MEELHTNLVMELKRHRLTQEDVAGWLKLSRASLNARMRGRVDWSLREIYVLMTQLNLPYKDIYKFFPPNPRWGIAINPPREWNAAQRAALRELRLALSSEIAECLVPYDEGKL